MCGRTMGRFIHIRQHLVSDSRNDWWSVGALQIPNVDFGTMKTLLYRNLQSALKDEKWLKSPFTTF